VPWLAHDLFAEWKLASSRQTLYAVVKRLVGAKWGRCVVLKGNFDPTSGKAKQARVALKFIKAYAHALKLQAETKTPGVDAGRLVAHTHANINAWIKADGVLQGTVRQSTTCTRSLTPTQRLCSVQTANPSLAAVPAWKPCA
jgi:hypothetical protein